MERSLRGNKKKTQMKLRYTTQAQIDIDITVEWYENREKV
jgi:hypothetical protein